MKSIINVLQGKQTHRTPIWFMRQAGRYLPEYKKIRSQHSSFMEAVLTPETAAEITLQPLRRFDLDAAIIFSDILVLPYAMNVKVEFHENVGPVLEYDFDPAKPTAGLAKGDKWDETIAKICKTISLVRNKLAHSNITTIGFAGSPWTVACYMLEKNRVKGTEFQMAKQIAYEFPSAFKKLIEELTEATTAFLFAQIDAGAEVIKLFDSHAGLLEAKKFQELVIEPTRKIVQAIKKTHPHIPIIGFPRKAGVLYEAFVSELVLDGIAVDHTLPLKWIKENLQSKTVVQGNLDNVWLTLDLTRSQRAISDSVMAILKQLNSTASQGFIFNLGHGCLPSTRIENIEFIIRTIRDFEIS